MRRDTAPPRQVALAYALLASVLAAAWFTLGQPLVGAVARGEARIEALQDRIDALERAASRDVALDPELGRRRIEQLRVFIRDAAIEAETLEVGASLLQRRLTGVVEKSGGSPGNTRVTTDSDAGTMTVSAQFATELPALVDILYELETAKPLLLVDLLLIRRSDPYLETVGGAGVRGLQVQIDVSAFWNASAADGSG